MSADPNLPERYLWRCPGTTKSIRFSDWGAEFPIFDDVMTVIDRAEDGIERDLKVADDTIRGGRAWEFGTARLIISNRGQWAREESGFQLSRMLVWLKGLRAFGMVYGGFWTSTMNFRDVNFWLGNGALQIVRPSRPNSIDPQ